MKFLKLNFSYAVCLIICSSVINGYPIHVLHPSLLKEHNILTLLGMILIFMYIYGSYNGIIVGSVV
jgi:hypothetical protein